jgi:hypothetical protein
VDSAGSAYVTGLTSSIDFPTHNPIQLTKKSAAGKSSAFVTKLSPGGNALVYSTYLGGSDSDYGRAIALSATGEAFVAGTAVSTDFPTTAGAFQAAKAGVTGFVAKVSAAGDRLAYSTYLGGTGITDSSEGVSSIAVDATGNAYVTGMTSAVDFPTMNPLSAPKSGALLAGAPDAFVTKLNPVGGALLFSTYLGGSSLEDPAAIAVDSSGNVYVAGLTRSTDFPVAVNAFQPTDPNMGRNDTGFVAKLNPTTSVLMYSTYLGGSLHDGITSLAVDSAGYAFVGGFTESTDFPTASPLQATNRGTARLAFNGILAQLNASGSALLFGTYLGGSGSVAHIPLNPAGASRGDVVDSIVLDKDGNLLVGGSTASPDFPLATAYQAQIHTAGSEPTGFVAKIKMTSAAPGGGSLTGGKGGRGAIDWVLLVLLGLALAVRWGPGRGLNLFRCEPEERLRRLRAAAPSGAVATPAA